MDVGGRQRLERVVEVYAAGAWMRRSGDEQDVLVDNFSVTTPGNAWSSDRGDRIKKKMFEETIMRRGNAF